jgi:hypothetical protein
MLEQIQRLYGGMGSFNDLFVTDRAGHHIEPGNIDRVNTRLQQLQQDLFLAVTSEIEWRRASNDS